MERPSGASTPAGRCRAKVVRYQPTPWNRSPRDAQLSGTRTTGQEPSANVVRYQPWRSPYRPLALRGEATPSCGAAAPPWSFQRMAGGTAGPLSCAASRPMGERARSPLAKPALWPRLSVSTASVFSAPALICPGLRGNVSPSAYVALLGLELARDNWSSTFLRSLCTLELP